MSTGLFTALANIQQIVQIYIELPSRFDPETHWKISEKFKKTGKRKIPVKWYICNGILLGIYIFSFIHLISLFSVMKTSKMSMKSFEEMMIYVIIIGMITQALVSWYTFETNPDTDIGLHTELPSICGEDYLGWPSSKRLPSFEEASAYVAFIGFSLFPIVTGTFPWIRDYDPITKLFRFLPELPRKIVSSIVLAGVTFFGASLCILKLIGIVAGSICIIKIARENFKRSQNEVRNIENGVLWKMNEINEKFNKIRRHHNQLQILVQIINKKYGVYIPVLQLVGILLCVFGNFGVVAFHGKIELIIVFFCGAISSAFTVFNFFILDFNSRPNSLTEEVIWCWRKGQGKLGKVEKKELRAMQVISIRMGGFDKIKRTSGMEVLDSVMDYTMQTITIWNKRK